MGPRMRVTPLSDKEAEAIRDLVPVPRETPAETTDEGVAFVVDKELGWLSERIRRLLGGSSTIRWQLDGEGAYVWERIDGRRSVGRIAEDLVDRYGDAAEPALARTWIFVQMLRRKGIVEIRGLS